jgi:phage host-nuclease inhibitor protein Gam
MARRRTVAQRAPQTTDEAVTLLGEYAGLDARMAAINAQREAEIAAVNTAADQQIVAIEARMKEIFRQLSAWWAVAEPEMTGGKARSIELGGCQIGLRLTPPKLTHQYAKDAEAAVALRATAYGEQLTKISYTLDKPAILRTIDAQDEAGPAESEADGQVPTLRALGFAPKQTDEFFVSPLHAASAATISTPAA